MKRCPKCFRANADEAVVCVLCNESLAEVDATLRFDPEKDAEEWAKSHALRTRILRRDMIAAAIVYAVAIDFTVVIMGFLFDPLALLLFFLSALVVAFAVCKRIAGQFIAAFMQGGMSVALLAAYIPLQNSAFLVFILILAHLVLPILFCHWIDGMRDMYR